MKKRKGYSPKRRIEDAVADTDEREALRALSRKVRYGGHPNHKRTPGDFGLNPPADPRLGATLCDGAGIFERDTALALLREGIRRGLVSRQKRNGWPQNVWAVTDDGIALEAQLENPDQGIYHGYPMPARDPLREEVLRRWRGE